MPRPRSATASDTRSSLNREQWVAAAVDLLVDGGIDQVRVDVLAKRLGVTRGSFYWLAIRDWARRDPLAQQAVDEADASRVSYIAPCFSALGFGIAEARHRAGVLHAYEVGEAMLPGQGSASHKAERSALAVQLLLTPSQKTISKK